MSSFIYNNPLKNQYSSRPLVQPGMPVFVNDTATVAVGSTSGRTTMLDELARAREIRSQVNNLYTERRRKMRVAVGL